MADESLGSLSLLITGDYSGLAEAISKAVGIAEEGAKAIEEAFVVAGEAFAEFKIFEGILDIADQFEEATRIIVADSGQIGESLEEMNKQFADIFSDVPQSAEQVAGAFVVVKQRLDETNDEAAALTKTILDLSTITGESGEKIADSVTKAFNNWHVATENQIQELTNLRNISAAAAEPIGQLLDEVTRFGPLLRDMGVSLDQGAELIANLSEQGINSQRVFMALNTEVTKLAKEGVPDVTAAMADWIDKIKNAATESDALQIASSAGARGATQLTEAIRSGVIDFDNFAGKLKISNASIDDQRKAAETLGQTWTTVLHQLEADISPVTGFIADLFKTIGSSLTDFLKTPELALAKWEVETELVVAKMATKVSGIIADHPVAALLFGIPTNVSAAAPAGASLLQSKLEAELSAIQEMIDKTATSVDNLHTKIPQLPAPPPALRQGVEEIATAFDHTFKAEEAVAKEAGVALKAFSDAVQNSVTSTPGAGLDKLIDQLSKVKQDMIDAGQTSGIVWGQINDAIETLARNGMADLQTAMDELAQRTIDGTSKIADSFNRLISEEAKFQAAQPFDDFSESLRKLGVEFDGLTKKQEDDLNEFDKIVNSQAATISTVEGAWVKVQAAIQNLANDPEGLKKAQDETDKYEAALERLKAPLQAQLSAQVQIAAEALKEAEANSNNANYILQVGENLEIAKSKQNAFNDALNGELNLFKGVEKAFSDAYTEFGNGIADAITGTESFGQAFTKMVADLEKKLAELVVNFLLGQLKDAILADTNALGDFAKLFNSLFGISTNVTSGGSGGGAVGSATGAAGAAAQGGFSASSVGSALSSTMDVLTGILNVLNGIIQDFEIAHIEKQLAVIEGETRRIANATEISTNAIHEILGYIQQSYNFLWNPLAQYLQNFNVDLDIIAGGSRGGSSTSSSSTSSQPVPVNTPANPDAVISADSSLMNTLNAASSSITSLGDSAATASTSMAASSESARELANAQVQMSNISTRLAQSTGQAAGVISAASSTIASAAVGVALQTRVALHTNIPIDPALQKALDAAGQLTTEQTRVSTSPYSQPSISSGLTIAPPQNFSGVQFISPNTGLVEAPAPYQGSNGLPSSIIGNQSGAAITVMVTGNSIYGTDGAQMISQQIVNTLKTAAGQKLF